MAVEVSGNVFQSASNLKMATRPKIYILKTLEALALHGAKDADPAS